jgi:hypothetical protein
MHIIISAIFGTNNIRWYTEKHIEKTLKRTRTDLVIEENGGSPVLAIEFKTRKTEGVCLSDKDKLKIIPKGCTKVFCALVDIKDGVPKDWFENLKGVKTELLNEGIFDYFSTKDYHTDSSKSFNQTRCIVAA